MTIFTLQKVTFLFLGSRLTFLNFHNANKRIVQSWRLWITGITSPSTITSTAKTDKLIICVSQQQALFVKRDARWHMALLISWTSCWNLQLFYEEMGFSLSVPKTFGVTCQHVSVNSFSSVSVSNSRCSWCFSHVKGLQEKEEDTLLMLCWWIQVYCLGAGA